MLAIFCLFLFSPSIISTISTIIAFVVVVPNWPKRLFPISHCLCLCVHAMSATELLPLFGVLALFAGLLAALNYLRTAPAAAADTVHADARALNPPARADHDVLVPPAARRRRGGLARMRRAAATDVTTDADADEDADAQGEEATRRKSKKEANREAKREAQEARQAALEAYREREADAEEQRRVDDEREADDAADEAARLADEVAQREQHEQDVYDEWKGLISVEDAGHTAEAQQLEDPGLLRRFCEFVREAKVVVLEEVAAEFQLRTEDVIDRLTKLEEAGTLTGFFDDRGKFIYVSMQEMEHVAELIERRGRISIQELAVESTKLLHLDTLST